MTWQGDDTKITSMHTSAELDLSAGVGRSHSVRLFSADPMSAYYHIADAQNYFLYIRCVSATVRPEYPQSGS